jgi:uncharacterized protein (TIGR02145 family)
VKGIKQKTLKMKKENLILSVVLMTAITVSSCGRSVSNEKSSSKEEAPSNQVTVVEEVTAIEEITIGTQIWMTQNLNVAKFRNGDSIPQAKTNEEWKKAGKNKQPAWCYYDNNQKNGEKYGKLYNWYAVNDARNMAPKGWHIPSDAEWTEIQKQLLESKNSKIGLFNNYSGFRLSQGKFNWINKCAGWWSTTEITEYAAVGRSSYGNSNQLGGLHDDMDYGSKILGLSVRCVKDNSTKNPY